MAFAAVKKSKFWVLGIVVGVLLADQLTKFWALRTLDTKDIDLFWTLRLNLIRNSGTILGLGGNFGLWLALFGILAAGALLWVILWGIKYKDSIVANNGYLIGIAFMLGGAVGNLGDRMFRSTDGFGKGSVIDFIDLQWWPIFNVADASITIGIVLISATNLFSILKS